MSARTAVRWARAAAGIVVLTVLAASLPGCTSDEAGEVPEDKGRLRIAMGGLPGNSTGHVKVKGDSGDWDLTGSGEIDVAPGGYTVTVDPVRTSEGGRSLTRYGADDTQQVNVAAGQVADVDARYRLAVPETTKIVEQSKPSPIERVERDRVVLRPGVYADQLRAGDVIVAGESPATPEGICVRVTGVERAGGRVVVRTSRVDLGEAIPVGVLRISDDAGSGGQRSAADQVDVKADFDGDHVHASGFLKGETHHDWSGTDINWDLLGERKFVEVKLSYRSRSRIESGYSIDAAFSRPKLRREADLGGAGKVCGKKLMKVARVVSPMNCELEAYVELAASVKGQSKISAESFQASQRSVEWRGGELESDRSEPTKAANTVGKVQVELAAEGSVGLTGGLKYTYRGGPRLVDVGIAAKLELGVDAQVAAQAWKTPVTYEASGRSYFRIAFEVDIGFLFSAISTPALVTIPAWTHELGTWSRELDPGAVNTRKPHVPKYTRQAVEAALPGYQPDRYQVSISDRQPWGRCLDSNVDADPSNDCPMEDAKLRPASALVYPPIGTGQLDRPTLWLMVQVFPTHEQADQFIAKVRKRTTFWAKGRYKTPGGRVVGYRQWVEGDSTVEDLQGATFPGAIQVKRSQTVRLVPADGGTETSQPTVSQQFIYYRRHNIVIEAGGDQLAPPGADPTAYGADAIPDVTTILLGFLKNLGEPR